jgi:predicted PurR-regulated permease PerM
MSESDQESSADAGRDPVRTVRVEPRQVRRLVVLAAVAAGVYQVGAWSLSATGSLLLNIAIAWLIAISIEPVVAGLARRGWRRGAATGLVLGALGVLACALVAITGTALVDQLGQLADGAPGRAVSLLEWANATFGLQLDTAHLDQALNWSSTAFTGLAAGAAGGVLSVVGMVAGGLFTVASIAVFAYYLSADAPRLQQFIAQRMPQDRQQVFLNVWNIAVGRAGAYMVSRMLLASISAAAHVAAFYLLDVPYWLPMGVFAGLVSQFLPTIGTYIGVAVPALLAVTVNPWTGLWVLVFATVYQQIENYVLTPRISRATMDMNPGVALAAVIAGAALFGPIGALIGIPAAAIGLALLEAYAHRYDLHPDLRPAAEDLPTEDAEDDLP